MDAVQDEKPKPLLETGAQKNEKKKRDEAVFFLNELIQTEITFNTKIKNFIDNSDYFLEKIITAHKKRFILPTDKNKEEQKIRKEWNDIIKLFKIINIKNHQLLANKIDEGNFDAQLKILVGSEYQITLQQKIKQLGILSVALQKKLLPFIENHLVDDIDLSNDEKSKYFKSIYNTASLKSVLQNLFMEPTQRYPRYALTTKEIITNLDDTHPDKANLNTFADGVKTEIERNNYIVGFTPDEELLNKSSEVRNSDEGKTVLEALHNIIRCSDYFLQTVPGQKIDKHKHISHKHEKDTVKSISDLCAYLYFNLATTTLALAPHSIIHISNPRELLYPFLEKLKKDPSEIAICYYNSIRQILELNAEKSTNQRIKIKGDIKYIEAVKQTKLAVINPQANTSPKVLNSEIDGNDDDDDDDDKLPVSSKDSANKKNNKDKKDPFCTYNADKTIADHVNAKIFEIFSQYNNANGVFKFFKNMWKPEFISHLEKKLGKFDSTNMNEFDIWKWHVYTIKEALEKANKLPYTLITGDLKKALEQCINYLDFVSPKRIITSSENNNITHEPLSSAKKILSLDYSNSTSTNIPEDKKLKISEEANSSHLLANFLRIYDYYANTLLGANEIVLEENIVKNTKDLWKNELASLKDKLLKLYFDHLNKTDKQDNEDEKFKNKILAKIKLFANNIQTRTYVGTRLGNHLAILFNSYKPNKIEDSSLKPHAFVQVPSMPINKKCGTLPKGVIQPQMSNEMATRYINKHTLDSVKTIFQAYTDDVESRWFSSTNPTKNKKAIEINSSLYDLNDNLNDSPIDFMSNIWNVFMEKLSTGNDGNKAVNSVYDNGYFGDTFDHVKKYINSVDSKIDTDYAVRRNL